MSTTGDSNGAMNPFAAPFFPLAFPQTSFATQRAQDSRPDRQAERCEGENLPSCQDQVTRAAQQRELVTPLPPGASPHSPRNPGARFHRATRLLIVCVIRYPVPLPRPLADLLFRTLQIKSTLNLRRAVIMCQGVIGTRAKAHLPLMETPSRVRAQASVQNGI
ncbi:hypothetical protein J3F83DRAFT_357483 [Trichoderma novae-zelandiae]